MSLNATAENLSTPIVIAGTLEPPRRSSVSKGWNGVVLETYDGWHGSMVAQYPFHVVSLQLSGRRTITQRRNGRSLTQVTRAGTIIITPMGPEKEWSNGDQTDCEFLVINLSPSLLQRILEDRDVVPTQNVQLLDNFGTRDLQLEGLALRLLEEFRSEEFASGIYVEALATQIAIQLLRRYSTLRQLNVPQVRKLSRREFIRATEYIDENLCGDLTVSAIADAVSMSTSHFARAFKQSTGLSPHNYVLERRIEKAKALLRDTDLAMGEIANRIGFCAASHFSVAFARSVGATPRDYRRGA
jgi:AraC family transcriptional regulator